MTTPTLPVIDPGPSVPPKVRTITYFAGLGIAGLATLVTGVTAAVAPHAAVTVLAVCGAVTGAVSLVVSGLAAAFRPTAGQLGAGEVWGDGTPVATTPVVGDAPAA